MFSGCYTALVTPLTADSVDYAALEKLVEFQVSQGVSGIVAVGTTGESPTLSWDEHHEVILAIFRAARGRCTVIAGTGSNSTRETLDATEHVAKIGIRAVLLVDPYYNGPSSLEIRREYIEPVAKKCPDVQLIPYVIPGRTGTQLLPEDLAILHARYRNVRCVKEATGSLDNMRRTRECCGQDFDILSGDDDKTLAMMLDNSVAASGVVSVASNIAPGAVHRLTQLAAAGKKEEANRLAAALKPLFDVITVSTEEATPHGPVRCKARNPLGTKTLMNVLGMPAGPCRPPLGKMTKKGLEFVLGMAREVQSKDPDIFAPIAKFFGVNIAERLNSPPCWRELSYDSY